MLVDQHLEAVTVARAVDAGNDEALGRGLAGDLERTGARGKGSLEAERVLRHVLPRAGAVHEVAGERAVLVAVLGRADKVVMPRLVLDAGAERQFAAAKVAAERAAQRSDRAFAEFVAVDPRSARAAERGQR